MKKLPVTCFIAALLLGASLITPDQLSALGNEGIIIAPTRVVFEGRNRSQIVRLINPDSKSHSYRLSLVYLRMDDFGGRKAIDSPDRVESLAASMIRYAPRQVTIPAKGWQTVRVMVRKPANLAAGEYRVHLKFSSLPDQEEPTAKKSDKTPVDPGKVGVQINILMDITIPLIIRQGQGEVGVAPIMAKFKPEDKRDGQSVEVELERTGKYSLFADVALFADSNGKSSSVPLGEIRGIAIYTPNTIQYVNVPLGKTLPGTLQGKTIRVEIRDRDHGDTKPLLSSKELIVE